MTRVANTRLGGYAVSVARACGRVLVEWPLGALFMWGPSPIGWGGLEPSAICARMTGTEQGTWEREDNRDDCEQLILRRFDSWVVTAYVTAYGVTALLLLRRLVSRGRRPIVIQMTTPVPVPKAQSVAS